MLVLRRLGPHLTSKPRTSRRVSLDLADLEKRQKDAERQSSLTFRIRSSTRKCLRSGSCRLLRVDTPRCFSRMTTAIYSASIGVCCITRRCVCYHANYVLLSILLCMLAYEVLYTLEFDLLCKSHLACSIVARSGDMQLRFRTFLKKTSK